VSVPSIELINLRLLELGKGVDGIGKVLRCLS
jgi:hypothetical protein